jgi:hypothetical protein
MYEVIVISDKEEVRLATFGDKEAARRHAKIINEVLKEYGYHDTVYDIVIREITDKMY